MDAPDAYTVVFHTKRVFAPFLTSMGEAAILPAHYFRRSPSFVASGGYNHDPYNRTPFGTGPYRVAEWVSADHITLVPNTYYWGRKPYFQRVIVKIVPSSNTLLVQLHTGEVQLARVRQQQVEEARGIPGTVLVARPGQAWYHIDLKQYGFLRDQAVRVALDYATPKRAILDKILHGYGQVADGDIAPTSWAYTAAVPTHPFNLATAAALLASDGFTKGPDGALRKGGRPLAIQLWHYSSDAQGAQIDDILKYEWGRIGVGVDVRHQDVSTIFGPTGPEYTRAMTGIGYAWFNGNDPDDSYYWNSASIPASPTGAGGNSIAYFHRFSFQKEIDDLTDAGLATVDRARRKAIYARIERLLAAQVPVIFLDWEPLLYARPRALRGFDPNAFNNLFYNIQDWRY